MLLKDTQLKNASSPIEFTVSGRVNVSRSVQSLKDSLPIVSKFWGNFINFNSEQKLKARFPILTIEFGRMMVFHFLYIGFPNAFSETLTTL